jgi:hypothetical protein
MARNGELSLDEMLKADIVRLLMRRDGVTEGEVRAVMRRAIAKPPSPGRPGRR